LPEDLLDLAGETMAHLYRTRSDARGKIVRCQKDPKLPVAYELKCKDYYRQIILPELTQKVLERVLIPAEHKAAVSQYILWAPPDAEPTPDILEKKLALESAVEALPEDLRLVVEIAKEWLSTVIPHIFAKRLNVDFGALFITKGGVKTIPADRQIAVPYISKDRPSERSEYSNPDIQIGLTYIRYCREGLSQENLKQVLERLIKLMKSESHVTPSKRHAVKIFSSWLKAVGAEEQFQLGSLKLEDSTLQELHIRLACHPPCVREFLNFFVFPIQLKQYEKQLSTNAIEIFSILSKNTIGFTGTTHNAPVFPDEFTVRPQEGTDGKILYNLLLSHNNTIEEWPSALDADVFAGFDLNSGHAIIDAGALITGLTNKGVAEEILRRSSEDQYDGVGFVDDATREIKVLHRDGSIDDIDRATILKKRLIMYFSHSDITGIDTQLYPLGRGDLTLSHTMTLRDYFQATMRLRLFGEGQTIRTIVPYALAIQIRKYFGLPETQALAPTHILKWLYVQSKDQLTQEIFIATQQKLKMIVRKHVISTFLNFKIWKEVLTNLLVDSLETDYYKTHHGLPVLKRTSSIFTELKIDLLSQLYDRVFTPDLDTIEKEMNEAINKALLLLPKFWMTGTSGLDKEMQCVAEKSRLVETERATQRMEEKEMRSEKEKEAVPGQLTTSLRPSPWGYWLLETNDWKSHIVRSGTSLNGEPGDVMFVPIHRLMEEQIGMKWGDSSILATDRFLKAQSTYKADHSKIISHVLELRENGSEHPTYILISNDEAEGIITYLRACALGEHRGDPREKNKLILRDYRGHVLAKNTKAPVSEQLPPSVSMRLKFLRSEIEFSDEEKKELQRLVAENDQKDIEACFHALMAANNETMGPRDIEDLWT